MLYVCAYNCKENLMVSIMKFLVVTTAFFLLSACGGPPQNSDNNSEGPAVLSATSDSNFSFGETLTGFSYDSTISIYNESLTVTATDVSLSSNLRNPFRFAGGSYPGTGGTCGDEIAPRAICTIAVELNPTTVGSLSSSFSLSYFDGLADQTASFTFTSQSRAPVPGNLTMTPAGDHDFGILAIGGFSDRSYTITNPGELPATSVNFSGLNAPFTIHTNSCGATINAGASCNLTVRFAPSAAAVFSDTLSLSFHNGVSLQSQNRNFTGEGRVAGFLAIDQGFDFDFGLINSGFTASQTLTVRNTGGGNASSISFGGITAPFSVFSNNCPATIAPTGTCTIVIRFSPTATGDFTSEPSLDYFDGFNNQSSTVSFAGFGFANSLTLTLVSPATSPGTDSSPTIRVSGVVDGAMVRLYRNATCTAQVANGNASGASIEFSPTIAEGTYQFHARVEDDNSNLSTCSASEVVYQYDNTAPNSPSNITLSTTFVGSATSSPVISWTLSPSADVTNYQVGISTSAVGGNAVSGWTSKGNVSNATQTGLSLTQCTLYYASVRALDHVGLASTHAVSTQSFSYDTANPTAPTSLAVGGDASDTNSATINWTASTDNCAISYYQAAVSEDTNNNGILDAGEIGNVVAYTNIGNVTSHRFNGLNLTTGINHYTSIRAVDTAGRVSPVAVSGAWIIYNPSIELPDMIAWLDANDPSTIFDQEGDAANSGAAFSGSVQTWLDKSGSTYDHDFSVISGSTRPTFVNGSRLSLQFNGTSTGLTTPNHNEINLQTVVQRNITVAFRTSANITSRQVLYEEGGNVRGMNIYIYNGQLYCGFYNNTSDVDGIQPFTWVNTAISANTVYYVTWVFDYTNYTSPSGPDGSLNCYLNGAHIGSQTTTSRLFGHSGAVGVGQVNNQTCFEDGNCNPPNGSYFQGNLYELMLFNNAPNASDVSNVHTYLSNKWD